VRVFCRKIQVYQRVSRLPRLAHSNLKQVSLFVVQGTLDFVDFDSAADPYCLSKA